jgi:hypothetical protein
MNAAKMGARLLKKYRMKHILYLFVVFAITTTFVTSCETEEDGEKKTVLEEEFVGIVTDFKEGKFNDPVHEEILRELDICEFKSADSTYFATCSPENFKIVEYKDGASVRDAFILEMKAGIFPKDQEMPLPPVRHVIVFEREGGKLVRVGGFRGDLIGLRENKKTGAKDLLMALYDTDDETLFHCSFVWNGKKYEFEAIERLDYGDGFRKLKGKDKVETTQQIFQQLREKSLIF